MVVAAIIFVCASCGGSPHLAALETAPCGSQSADYAKWQRLDRGDFSFALPPRFHKLPGMGVDSWVEQYASADGTEKVEFDYGQWSNDLRADSDAYEHYTACIDTIGGRSATVVTLTVRDVRWRKLEGPYVAAAAWRSVIPESRIGTHLTLWTQTSNVRRLGELLAVLRSVEFAQRSPAPSGSTNTSTAPAARAQTAVDTVRRFQTETSIDSTLAQGEVAGRLVSASTGLPVLYGEVSIVYPDHRHTMRRVFANDEGRFRIKGLPEERGTLYASAYGFRTDSVAINPGSKILVRFALAVSPMVIRY